MAQPQYFPPDGATAVGVDTDLTWTTDSSQTNAYDVYLGTDQAGVQNASHYPGDLDGSGQVDIGDLARLTDCWLWAGKISQFFLVSHWSFDSDASDSVDGHAGTLVNGAAITNTPTAYYVGTGALSLDGIDDYVEIPGYKGITGGASRTCMAWIRTNMTQLGVILSWGHEQAGEIWTFHVRDDGTLGLAVWGGYIKTTAAVNDGQWHHVAAVLTDDGSPDVSEVLLYIDGILQTDTSASSTQSIDTAASQDVMIGVFDNAGVPSVYFDGLVDDVRIYDAALTESQIQAEYDADLGPCYSDIEGSGRVDLGGFAELASAWLESNSPEFMTRTAFQSYDPGTMTVGPHYWRIDSIDTDGNVYAGNVLNFTTSAKVFDGVLSTLNDFSKVDLDGTIIYAINCGSTTDVQVGSVLFRGDVYQWQNTAGDVNGDGTVNWWDTQYHAACPGKLASPTPISGVTVECSDFDSNGMDHGVYENYHSFDVSSLFSAQGTDASNMAHVLSISGIQNLGSPGERDMIYRLDVTPGHRYKLQLFFYKNSVESTGMDILVEGRTVVEGLDVPVDITNAGYDKADTVLVYSSILTASDSQIDIVIKRDPALFNIGDINAMTLEDISCFTTANDPVPANEGIADSKDLLMWAEEPSADSYDVYFGTDYDSVLNATIASNEFKGNQTAAMFDSGIMTKGNTYYWRVDIVNNGNVCPGDVWEFMTYNDDGLTASIYNNKDFTEKTVTRIDNQIAFDWVEGSPDPAIDVDTFSIVWKGGIRVPEKGEYTFYTDSDDGVRLYINNILIIDQWIDQGLTEHSGRIKLRPGTVYSIQMEYYENGGAAAVYLSWSGPGFSKQIIPRTYLTSTRTERLPKDVWVINLDSISSMTERVLALNLQGLVAKEEPTIWVQQDGLTAMVREELQQQGTVFHDNASFWDLLDRFHDYIDGIILYRDDLEGVNAATSLCGPMNGIAVVDSMLNQVQSKTGLDVIADVRGYNAAATYSNYQDLFGHEIIVDVNKKDFLRDIAVMRNAFIFFNVSPAERRQYVDGLTSQGTVLGWGSNAEWGWIEDLSVVNASGIAADWCRNLSPLSRIPSEIPSPPKKYPAPAQEGERIVAFVMSDGDNLQVLGGSFIEDNKFFGSPYRGTFSMSWEFPPRMADLIPMGATKYYELASSGTNVDCFIAGPSGAGYTFPCFIPYIQSFAENTGRLMEKCRLKVTTILNDNSGDLSDSDEFLDRPEIMGVVYKDYVPYNRRNGAIYWHNGKPCISYKYVLWEGIGDWDTVSTGIASMPSSPNTDQGSYALVNAHAWSFDDIGGPMEAIKGTVDRLPPNTRVVTVEEFIILLRNNFGNPITEQQYNAM